MLPLDKWIHDVNDYAYKQFLRALEKYVESLGSMKHNVDVNTVIDGRMVRMRVWVEEDN